MVLHGPVPVLVVEVVELVVLDVVDEVVLDVVEVEESVEDVVADVLDEDVEELLSVEDIPPMPPVPNWLKSLEQPATRTASAERTERTMERRTRHLASKP